MLEVRTAILTGASAVLVALTTACADAPASSAAGDGGGGPPALVTGTFRGTYEVPVGPDLAAAAVYDVPKIRWDAAGGDAKLDYDLPLGLVGTALRVELTGPLDATASGTLSGAAGTASCSPSATGVVCHEQMDGLMPISIDYAEVTRIAAAEYAGPASDRLDVAKRFAGDPIGILHVDLGAPVPGETD